VGQVSGRNAAAVLVTVAIRTMLRLLASTDRKASEVLAWINRGLVDLFDRGLETGISVVVIDTKTGMLDYAGTAMPALMLCRHRSGLVDTLASTGTGLGHDRAATFSSATTQLARGDSAILFSRGLIDTENEQGQRFGIERLEQLVLDSRSRPSNLLAGRLRESLGAFAGTAQPVWDQTMLAMKMEPHIKGGAG